MLKSTFSRMFGLDTPFEAASTVLFGAPYDSTTSFRPGARFGPAAMRSESFGLETYSPYCDRDIADCAIQDAGDLELCFGAPEGMLADIETQTASILDAGKRPVMLGGEHLVTLGAVRAAAKRYEGLHVLHFDAHADLRGDYLGARLSHATVMRRCAELLGDGRVFQFGIRSGERAEFEWARAHTHMTRFTLDGLSEAVTRIGTAPVYLTIDLDVLDPSAFPGTGTPEAGGVSFMQLLEALNTLIKCRIVACDLVELAPVYDPGGVSTATACKVLRELLLGLEGA